MIKLGELEGGKAMGYQLVDLCVFSAMFCKRESSYVLQVVGLLFLSIVTGYLVSGMAVSIVVIFVLLAASVNTF